MDGSSVTDAALRQDYLDRAQELVPMLLAAGDETEKHRQVPEPIVAAMVERGIFRMLLPKSIGGGELDPLTYTAVLEILAAADGSTAWCLGQNSGCSMTAPYLSHEMAVEIFGGPRGILAWGPELPGAGKCVAVEGGYRVTGRWGFATGSRHASWLGAHCPVFEADGSPRLGANGRQVVRTMLAPKSEATIIDNWQVLGLRGTGSDSYEFKDHFVPEARTAIRDNAAEEREDEKWNGAGETHHAQPECGTGQREHQPALGHVLHPCADIGEKVAAPEEPEVGVAQGADDLRKAAVPRVGESGRSSICLFDR